MRCSTSSAHSTREYKSSVARFSSSTSCFSVSLSKLSPRSREFLLPSEGLTKVRDRVPRRVLEDDFGAVVGGFGASLATVELRPRGVRGFACGWSVGAMEKNATSKAKERMVLVARESTAAPGSF
ncbi:eukaryotic translation initiation factor 3subunit I [Striga asiatica]|uniref:Eukaryotic translation initiation factor 3subunit I n=1 Tax=Striga asiatica TaxID=4170 RepID=A0A5A7P0C1_STRAF|nr:eukaryotic translation initiation factor 3subunit I [Striga asiatica]